MKEVEFEARRFWCICSSRGIAEWTWDALSWFSISCEYE